jgi:hypothetical protein
MPGPTRLILFEDRSGLVVQEDATQVINLISVARRTQPPTGFVKLTAGSGTTVFVAVDHIRYMESE